MSTKNADDRGNIRENFDVKDHANGVKPPHAIADTDAEADAENSERLQQIHNGWDHLRRHRPLAAWSIWQRVLRRYPGCDDARRALQALSTSPHMPRAALTTYRFLMPKSSQRARWNLILLNGNLDELDTVADVFAHLVAVDPADGAAGYNYALCLAWLGYNTAAIDMLERVVVLLAAKEPDQAVHAWKLAEVLRQGAESEPRADDLSYAMVFKTEILGRDAIAAWIQDEQRKGLMRDAPGPDLADARCYEWLDQPMPVDVPTGEHVLDVSQLPRVLGAVIVTPGSLRIATPDPMLMEMFLGRLPWDARALGERVTTPLPLTMLDAAAWSFRLPPGLLDAERIRLTGLALSHYYENHWLRIPRQGLEGLSPIQAGDVARTQVVMRIKLDAVLQFRAQVDDRSPAGAELGIHYDFDELRARLGLPESPAFHQRAAGKILPPSI